MGEIIRGQQLDYKWGIERMHSKYRKTPLSVLETGEWEGSPNRN